MMNLKKTLLILAFAALIANDACGLSGWESDDAAYVSIVDSSLGVVHSGSKAIKLTGEYGQQLNQEVTGLTDNADYLLTGYAYVNTIQVKGWSGAGLRIVVSDNKYNSILAEKVIDYTTDGWEKFSLPVKAPSSGSVWVRCYLYGIVRATAYIDNLWFGLADVDQVVSSGPGVAVDDSFEWGGYGKNIDSYNSNDGPYSSSNSSSNVLFTLNSTSRQDFAMWSSAKVMGDLKIGPDGNIDSVVALWSGSEVTGEISNLEEEVDMSKEALPSGGVFNNRDEGNFELYGSQTFTIDSDHYYKNLYLWSNSKLYIDGDVTLLIQKNLEIGDNAAIELEDDSTLTLFVIKNVNMGGKINDNTKDPSKVTIHMNGNNRYFQLYNSAKVHAVLNNPDGKVYIWSNSEFFGAIKCEDLYGGGKIHVDLANTFGGTTTTGATSPTGGGSVLP